jgi:hypothetical protein
MENHGAGSFKKISDVTDPYLYITLASVENIWGR